MSSASSSPASSGGMNVMETEGMEEKRERHKKIENNCAI